MKLKCQLRNNTDDNRTVFFPKGLLCKVNKEGYQNGILLQWSWVCIPPKSDRIFILHVFCINYGKSGSDAESDYNFLGITSSPLMKELCDKIGWRKINYEHYYGNGTSTSALKEENVTYDEIAEDLQNAVWSITNGDGLTDEHISFIESLPLLEEGTYPTELEDETVEYPYYFEEYTPVK